MPGTLTVGRLGFEVDVDDVSSIVWNGNTLTLNVTLKADSLAKLKGLRQAALGLVDNPDEEIVPITYSDDAHVDGFYRVTNVTVSTVPASLTAFWLPATITARRVAQYAAPLIESRMVGVLRTNSHGYAVGDILSWHGVPEDYEGYREVFTGRDQHTRDTVDGKEVEVFYDSSAPGTHYHDSFPAHHIPPANYYDGSARLTVESTVPTMGRQVANRPAGNASLTDWQLHNGIVRLYPDASNVGELEFVAFPPGGSDWGAVINGLELGFFASSTWYPLVVDPHTITVLRNSPEMVRIRLTYTGPVVGGLSDEFVFLVDLTIRRGANFIEGFLTTVGTNPPVAQWGIGFTATTACTTFTAGIRQTSDDADGNRAILGTPSTHTQDLTNGRLYLSSTAQTFTFVIGSELDGSSATGLDTRANTLNCYMSAAYESQRIMAR